MKYSLITTTLGALALALAANLAAAADAPAAKPKPAQAAVSAKTPAKTPGKGARPRAAPVDINSASKDELKKLPGIGDRQADQIIAGRPFLSKAHLQTRNIVTPGVYLGLKDLVIARQKDAKFAPEPPTAKPARGAKK